MIYTVLLIPLLGIVLFFQWERLSKHRKQQRRVQLCARRLPAQWQQLLASDFPLYRALPPDLQRKLEGHIQVFLDEKVFVGCNGFVITDEVRVLIAAQACVLILNIPGDYFPGFQTILVYPHTYVAETSRYENGLQTDSVHARAGESWHRGPVIVAWDQVVRGATSSRDGHNVVMHEFAHKLDEENHHMDGLPVLSDPQQYSAWAKVLSAEYERLCNEGGGVIDDYGATSAAEFFAVITEVFFERPRALQQQHPELYHQLQQYYRLHPVEWGNHT